MCLGLGVGTANAQLLPERRDGDIRVVYWDLTSETEVFLTLDLRSPGGEKLPVPLTLRVVFPGKRPAAPLTHVQVRADVGTLWAPEPRLSLALDGREIAFAPPGPSPLYSQDSDGAFALIGMVGTIPIATLTKLASARSVGGNVLRLQFELRDSQRDAIARFAERVLSADPGNVRGLR